MELFTQISAPGAPSVAVGSSGVLTGAYQYAVAFVTGYPTSDSPTPSYQTKGNTGGGTASSTVNPSSQTVSVSAIPIGPTGVVERILYRTKANGSTFYYLDTLTDNTTTTYTDNTPDTSLGAQMPTSNTTGGVFRGDGSGLTNLPSSILASVADQAVTTTSGPLLSYTPSVAGIYSVKIAYSVITATTNVSLSLAWTDPSAGAQTFDILTSQSTPIGGWWTLEQTPNCKANTAITISGSASVAGQVTATITIKKG